ncbi:MAG TPA: hypothetical protein VME22_31425 [Solirubrobacteraceae bacterium]|nr:hypothetical protein [Solirubrobacteraceae bacterium]
MRELVGYPKACAVGGDLGPDADGSLAPAIAWCGVDDDPEAA